MEFLPDISKWVQILLRWGHVFFAILWVGTSFTFNDRIKALVGSSTRKINQNTSQGLFRSILGSTGFGFIYDFNQILVQYGFYYYGVGVRVDGLNIGIRF